MQLQLLESKITNLNLTYVGDENSFGIKKLDYRAAFSDDKEERTFWILFSISVVSEEMFKVDIEYASKFSCSENITSGFIESSFPRVNAPAIAYPFLRSALANIMLQSGHDPVILPSYNFTKTKEKEG